MEVITEERQCRGNGAPSASSTCVDFHMPRRHTTTQGPRGLNLGHLQLVENPTIIRLVEMQGMK